MQCPLDSCAVCLDGVHQQPPWLSGRCYPRSRPAGAASSSFSRTSVPPDRPWAAKPLISNTTLCIPSAALRTARAWHKHGVTAASPPAGARRRGPRLPRRRGPADQRRDLRHPDRAQCPRHRRGHALPRSPAPPSSDPGPPGTETYFLLGSDDIAQSPRTALRAGAASLAVGGCFRLSFLVT